MLVIEHTHNDGQTWHTRPEMDRVLASMVGRENVTEWRKFVDVLRTKAAGFPELTLTYRLVELADDATHVLH
jgi:hypothetical protein